MQAVLALPFLPAVPQPLRGLLDLVLVGVVRRDFQLGDQAAVALDELLGLQSCAGIAPLPLREELRNWRQSTGQGYAAFKQPAGKFRDVARWPRSPAATRVRGGESV